MDYKLPGEFLLEGLLNNRPYYNNTDQSLLLYFSKSAACEAWIVGPVLGEANGIGYGHGVSAEEVQDWTLHSPENEWTNTIDFSFNCLR